MVLYDPTIAGKGTGMWMLRRHPLTIFFTLVYGLSAVGIAVLTVPALAGSRPPDTTALVVFPVMVIGVGVIGAGMTAAVDGPFALRDVAAGMSPRSAANRWAFFVLLPPAAILTVLILLRATVSDAFTPNFFPIGIVFGLAAGLTEEFAWSGFALPRMIGAVGMPSAAVLLGILWGLWHLPVADYLGAAHPHHGWWAAFFAAFVAVLVALRVLIATVYLHTRSLLLAQLLHASSTGCLAMLGPVQVTPAQETLWYAGYAAVLAIAATTTLRVLGRRSPDRPAHHSGADPRSQ